MANTSSGAAASAVGDDLNVEGLKNDVAELKREIAKLSSMVGDMAEKRYDQFRSQAAGVAQDYVDRGMALKDEAYERATAMEREVEKSIRERPIAAVAIAAGVGYLIGLVSRATR